MSAVQLIRKMSTPLEIVLINEKESLNRGAAYNPYSSKHLLNVIAGKMGAFPDQPGHFLQWVMERPSFSAKDQTLIFNSFLPRLLYGEYITEIWKDALVQAKEKNIKVTVIDGMVNDLDIREGGIFLTLGDGQGLMVNDAVIATGNQVPGNPRIANPDFYKSEQYFQNPWKIESVKEVPDTWPVLIIGNGLTMVDTVFGLLEQGFKGEIYSISPNGFNILPHRHNGLKYTKLNEELREDAGLHALLKLINKHIKTVREYGVSAEPIIDALRPHTQAIWQSLSGKEKELFMSRLRHLWGVARHRIPLHSHDRIQQLRIDGRLHIKSGRLLNLVEGPGYVEVEYFDKRSHAVQTFRVSRVINCTGPESDLMKLESGFLKSCLLKGILTQDDLKLGICANPESFRVLDAAGQEHPHLYTLGSSLKGVLWESTAVSELRGQAEKLAERLSAH